MQKKVFLYLEIRVSNVTECAVEKVKKKKAHGQFDKGLQKQVIRIISMLGLLKGLGWPVATYGCET